MKYVLKEKFTFIYYVDIQWYSLYKKNKINFLIIKNWLSE